MKKTAIWLLAACMAVTMTACGSGGQTKEAGAGTGNGSGAENGAAAGSSDGSGSAEQSGSQGESSGKTDLVVAVDADIETLHPSDYSTTNESTILAQLYDPLMYYNPDGTKEPEPRLAESYEVSEDGLTYTFHMRKDATFHDGTSVTAADAVFSLELYQNSQYQNSFVTGLDHAEAADDYTVVCHLENPYSPFLSGVCSVHIASKSYYEKSADEFASQPIGSGPYQFAGRNKGSNVSLEAYDGYYRGAAAIKAVKFEVIPDQSTKAIALQTGEVNFASIESASMTQLQADKNITIAEVPTSGFTYISMNMEKAPFDNVKVRQAVNYAVNRDNLVAICFDGEAEVNSNICSRDRFGYLETQPQYTYDPEKAKSLLAEAGITTPYNLGEMLVAEKYSNIATVVQNDLKAVGIDVTISVKEFNSYINDLRSGNYSITALNMVLDGDTQMLEMALTSDFINMANNARYSDPEMDELFAKARVENDKEARGKLFDQILTKAQEEAVYAVLCNPLTLYAYDSKLKCPEFPFEAQYSIYDFAW